MLDLWLKSFLVFLNSVLWQSLRMLSARERHLAPAPRHHTHAAAEKRVLSTRPLDSCSHHQAASALYRTLLVPTCHHSNTLPAPRLIRELQPFSHKKVKTWKNLNPIFKQHRTRGTVFPALAAGHPPAWTCFLASAPRGQPLPTSPIIHRVNKNGFGLNRRPVSCLKPTGGIVRSPVSHVHPPFIHRSHVVTPASALNTLTAWLLNPTKTLSCREKKKDIHHNVVKLHPPAQREWGDRRTNHSIMVLLGSEAAGVQVWAEDGGCRRERVFLSGTTLAPLPSSPEASDNRRVTAKPHF